MTTKPRWGRATLVLLGITVLMTELVVAANNYADHKRSFRRVYPHAEIMLPNMEPLLQADAYRPEYSPLIGPVPLGGFLNLYGDATHVARIYAYRAGPAAFEVHVQNLGTQPFDASFGSSGAWLDSVGAPSVGPSGIRILGSGIDRPSSVRPREEADMVLTFAAPNQGRPLDLRLCLNLGGYFPAGEWLL